MSNQEEYNLPDFDLTLFEIESIDQLDLDYLDDINEYVSNEQVSLPIDTIINIEADHIDLSNLFG